MPPSESTDEKKRIYSAYKPLVQTDGILAWTTHTHDNTVPWTPDDNAKYLEAFSRLGPLQRIEDMQSMLAMLPTDNPAINMHANAIRAIHDEVRAPPYGFTRERLSRLDEASAIWGKILIIRDMVPLAKQGAEHSRSQSQRRKGTGQDHAAIARFHARLVKNGDHDATSQTAAHFEIGTRQVQKILKALKAAPN